MSSSRYTEATYSAPELFILVFFATANYCITGVEGIERKALEKYKNIIRIVFKAFLRIFYDYFYKTISNQNTENKFLTSKHFFFFMFLRLYKNDANVVRYTFIKVGVRQKRQRCHMRI